METSLLDKDYTRRRGELSTFGRALNAANKVKLTLAAMAAATLIVLIAGLYLPPLLAVFSGVVVVSVGAVFLWHYISVHLVQPDLATRKWLQQICDGEFESTIELSENHPHFTELNFHTRNVGSSLKQLSDEMETLVTGQTQRLESRNQVLSLLFQLTSDVAHEIDQQSVLEKVCLSLSGWLGEVPVGAYLVANEQFKLQATAGSAAGVFTFPERCPVSELVTAVTAKADVVKIPISRGSELTGMVQIVGIDNDSVKSVESMRVFNTVSEQLGMFVAKNYAVESVQQARVVAERVRLGAEIHDSLAQTLLASKYQLRMLRETLENDPASVVLKDIRRLESTIDEANVEVRDLIGQTRQPTYDQVYVDSISSMIDEFNGSGSIPVFYQNDNPQLQVTAREGSVILRILRESLVNANKYSQANNIRVYLRVEHSGVRSLLIEDDGIGFQDKSNNQTDTGFGDHIGLAIMRDRAQSIGAILTVDSEPDEGTRITLKLPPHTLISENSHG